MARSDNVWSDSGEGEWGRLKDETDVDDELDRVCLTGPGCDTVRCQSGFSPDGLFRTVGRTSSRLAYAFVRFGALHKLSREPKLIRVKGFTGDPEGRCPQHVFVQRRRRCRSRSPLEVQGPDPRGAMATAIMMAIARVMAMAMGWALSKTMHR